MASLRATLALALVLLAACSSATKSSAARDEPLRVLVYNIRHGDGMDRVIDLERIAEVIRESGANVVLLQEVDRVCERSGGVDQAAHLGELCGMEHHFARFRDYDGGEYGMAALTSLPVKSFETIPLPPTESTAALEIVVESQGTEVVVIGVHLVTTEEERLAKARFLLERHAVDRRPMVLGGDLNSERTSSVLSAFYTQYDAPEKRGSANTFPAGEPIKEIDFVLLRPRNRWTVSEHFVIEESTASDHRPVLLEATLRR